MTIEYNPEEAQKRRRQKKLRRFLKKLIAVMVIVIIGLCVYIFRDKWLPLFEGIGTRYNNAIQNSGELAVGNFPIETGDDANYQTHVTDSYLTYLDDTHFYMFSADGEKVADRQHDYSSPVLRGGGKRALVYDSGGKKFRVESKQKTVYEKTMENNIILARISGNDMTAVVTESESFACVMNIFNADGTDCYTLKNVEGRITDIKFRSAGDGCIVSNISVSGGRLVSYLSSYSFSKAEADWQSQSIDTMIISVNILNDGTIAVIGDTKCAYYSGKGELIGTYDYPSTLVDYSCGSQGISFLFEKEELRKFSVVIIADITKPVSITVGDNAKSILSENGETYLLTSNGISRYTQDGATVITVGLDNDYIDFVKIGEYVYLKGYGEIDRINYES